MTIHGGCFCGAVRYRLSGELFHMTTCHCRSCRRVTGAPTVAWVSVAMSGFLWTQGTPATLSSSADVLRSFCAACGTALTYQHAGSPQEIDVTIASLDQPEAVVPADHTQTSARLPWVTICDDLPQYPHGRSEGRQA